MWWNGPQGLDQSIGAMDNIRTQDQGEEQKVKLKGMEGKFYYHDDYPHYHPMFPACQDIQSVFKKDAFS